MLIEYIGNVQPKRCVGEQLFIPSSKLRFFFIDDNICKKNFWNMLWTEKCQQI